LRLERSTVLRGFPSFLGQTTILLHHCTGWPMGTCSNTPSLTSLSSCSFTSFIQWMGIGTGLWVAMGLALGSTCSCRGGVDLIRGKGWWLHWLKAELGYFSMIQFSSFSLFSSEAGNGRVVGAGGGSVLVGQSHGLLSTLSLLSPVMDARLGDL
jgi:hypothetical protein